MRNHKNLLIKKVFYLVIPFIVLLFFFYFFLPKRKEPTSQGIDFIKIFNSAVKTNFDEKNNIDKYLAANSLLINISQIKDLNLKLFSGNPIILSKNGIETETHKSEITDGCFRTIFKIIPNKSSYFSYYIERRGSDCYWLVDLIIDEKAVLEIKEIENFKSTTIERLEIPLSEFVSDRFNIFFINDLLLIFTDEKVLFQCRHPALRGKGAVDFKYRGKVIDSQYSVKFFPITNELKKTVLERIESQLPATQIHKVKYSDPAWNLLGNEDSLVNVNMQSRYLRRLKLDDITMPSIYFLPGSSLEYSVKVTKNSLFSFYLALYHPEEIDIANGKFLVKISEGDENQFENFEYGCRDLAHKNPVFKHFCIDIKKYAGKKCKILFQFEGVNIDQKGLFQSSPIIALGSPVIYKQRERNEKNVILISIDTLRPDHLGIYGYKRNTSPNIDKFAKNSTVFLNATAQSNWTLTSHMSLFTALFPFETGYHKGIDVHQNVRFSDKVKLLTEYLKENVYKTGAITGGGYVSEYFGYDRGFDFYQINEKDCAKAMTKAIEWLYNSKNSKFFLFFHTYEVHKPYNHNYFLKDIYLKTATLKEQTIAKYDSGILYTDWQMGRLFDWLRKNNLYLNTLIIITSDHGENFDINDREKIPGAHGKTLYDSEIQIPLIIGGGINDDERGKAIKNQVSLIDLLPTIIERLELSIPENIRGIGLNNIMKGTEDENRYAYSEAVFSRDEKKSLRSIKYKIIKNLLNKRGVIKNEYELYDISEDRNELKNIFDNNIPIKNTFIHQLERIINEVNISYKALSIKTRRIQARTKDLEKQLQALGYLDD